MNPGFEINLHPFKYIGKYLWKVEGSGSEAHVRVEENAYGHPFFAPDNVFVLIGLLLSEIGSTGRKYIFTRDENGLPEWHRLKGTNGTRVECVLRTIHYNMDKEKRGSVRSFMGLAL